MHPPLFSIEESLRFGWEKTRHHSRLVFGVVLTLFAVEVVQAIVSRVLENTFLGIAATIVLALLGVIFSTGVTVIALHIAQDKPVSYSNIIPPAKLVWWYLCASLLAGIITLAGFVLLIIPGLYLMLRYAMVRFCIVDGSGITESLGASAKLTEGVKWHLLGFLLILIGINLIGAILFLVGLLVTIPVTMIAYAHIYLKLKHHHHHVEAKP